MNAAGFLEYLKSLPEYAGQIAHIEHIPSRQAVTGELTDPLHPSLADVLKKKGITSIYSHQAAAVNAARRGENVMVATSSASGKSLCYNLSAIEALLTAKETRALYLFPTKALAQDQLRVLKEWFTPGVFPEEAFATFDGDTAQDERSDIKRAARIILSNPDMLHYGILPNHTNWERFLRSLKYIVIDEAHTYRGIFGSHVSGVLRRLRRLCRLYGSNPQFICCSATIANPGEHAEKLTGLPFTVVDKDGSPHSAKEFVFWQPPIIDIKRNTRRSANSEATHLFTELVSQSIRTIAFARSRRLTETIFSYSKSKLEERNPLIARRIKPYRAGYLPKDRRLIERELFGGQLLGVVATVALELGVDIGDLAATILTGYPGSIASAWQQAGRSGRGDEASLSFLIGLNNPLDQYFMHHPEAFFQKNFENALINPENHYILRAHLLCAAWEQPLIEGDNFYFGDSFAAEMQSLDDEGLLRKNQRNRKWYLPPSISYPAQAVDIRSTSGDNYALIDMSNGALLETVDSGIAFFQIHTGAVYLHQGEPYIIRRLDLVGHTAYAEPTDANYHTQTKELEDLRIIKEIRTRQAGTVQVWLGEVEVKNQVLGFKKMAQYTEEVVGEEPLDLPPTIFPSVALWFDIPQAAITRIESAGLDFAGGIHAAEHAAIGMLPLFALCDRNDIGGVSTPLHPDTGKPQIFIYDAYPGGIGIAEKGFEIIEQLWEAAYNIIAECPCEEGCPSCIQSPKCGNNNKPLDKQAAMIILAAMLGRDV